MPVTVRAVDPRDPPVTAALDALTAELAGQGYTAGETFGYPVDLLVARGVHLVAAYDGGTVVGVGGIEIDGPVAELKRMWVRPERRGDGVADAVLAALLTHAAGHGVGQVRLETGIHQHAALRFYRRHGFDQIPPFGPYVGSATSVCLTRGLAP